MRINFLLIGGVLVVLGLVGCNTASSATETPRPVPSATAPRLISPTVIQTSASTQTTTPIPTPDTSTVVDSIKKIGDYQAWVVSKPNPPVQGNNVFQATIVDANGNAVDDAKVSFDLNMTNMNMGKNVIEATHKGTGQYEGTVSFSMGGPWRVILTIQRAGQPEASGQFNFSINR